MSTTLVTHPSTAETRQPEQGRPKRTTSMVGIAGVGVAALLLVLGAATKSNADFSENYVAEQLSAQRITFKAADALTPEEKATPCLVRYAGQPLTPGDQAECYANHFIGVHLRSVAEGKTYAQMRDVQTSLRAQVAQAQASNDPALADVNRQLADITAKRQTLFEGESSRGMLLTAYGFSTLGAKAGQASAFAFAGGAVLLALSAVTRQQNAARS